VLTKVVELQSKRKDGFKVSKSVKVPISLRPGKSSKATGSLSFKGDGINMGVALTIR